MDRDRVLDLLAIVAAADHRTTGEADVVLWQRAIGHLDADDCVDAIEAFRREQPGVWLEPGHVVMRVRAKIRDRIERAEPEVRPAMSPATARLPRDGFGAINKAAPDEELPASLTQLERSAAYWAKVRSGRDAKEHAMGVSGSPRLLTARAASSEVRTQVMADFAKLQYALDDEPEVPAGKAFNPLAVKCPFCKAVAGSKCVVAEPSGEKLATMSGHPSRLELAAREVGYSEDEAAEVATAACRRQAVRVRSGWSDRDRAPEPIASRGAGVEA